MQKYMKGKFVFYGIPSPLRRQLQRPFVQSICSLHEAFQLASALWRKEEREFQYVACDVLKKAVKRDSATITEARDHLRSVEVLISTKSWWDTVDVLASTIAGSIVLCQDHAFRNSIARNWIEQPDMWLQRSALLLQLKYGKQTDESLLFELVLHLADSKEFFLRKGAGWALREFSRHHPSHVRRFLSTHHHRLSALTVREAGKYC